MSTTRPSDNNPEIVNTANNPSTAINIPIAPPLPSVAKKKHVNPSVIPKRFLSGRTKAIGDGVASNYGHKVQLAVLALVFALQELLNWQYDTKPTDKTSYNVSIRYFTVLFPIAMSILGLIFLGIRNAAKEHLTRVKEGTSLTHNFFAHTHGTPSSSTQNSPSRPATPADDQDGEIFKIEDGSRKTF